MTPKSSEAPAVSEVYAPLRSAAIRRQPVAAVYDGQPRLLCPHVEAGRKADGTSCVINSAGGVIRSSRFSQRAWVYGVASLWRDSARSSCTRVIGTPRHVPGSKPALMMSISRWKLSLRKIRSRGNKAVGVVTGVPESCVASQSIVDYAAPDVRGDPRGRKSGAGLRKTNPR